MINPNRLNFGDLTRAEPALITLLADAVKIANQGKTAIQLNNIWYHDFKPRMETLVGMYRKDGPDFLRTSNAYDLAYATIHSCLTGE